VGSKALDPTRLECPLHDCGSSLFHSWGRRFSGHAGWRAPGPGPLVWMGGSTRLSATAPRIRRLILGKRGSLPGPFSACQCTPDPEMRLGMRRRTPPEAGLACYSRDRNRGFVVPATPACRRGTLRTSGRQNQNLCIDADMARFCPSLCHSLLLLFDFNHPIRRAG
jgi:hypothetical protein